jgi:hypothetical protein
MVGLRLQHLTVVAVAIIYSAEMSLMRYCPECTCPEDKSDDSKGSFREELGQLFDHFTKYHMKILLGDFNAKLGREDICKLTIGNENLHENGNDNGVRIVNITASNSLVVKNIMFLY